MNRLVVACVMAMTLIAVDAIGDPKPVADGKVRVNADNTLQAWDAQGEEWVEIEVFWDRYVARRSGLTWGSRTDYPPYDQVSEYDTMIIELDSGNCLMEFFHTRWRRANDVRRWDEAFNEYGSCPNVFD